MTLVKEIQESLDHFKELETFGCQVSVRSTPEGQFQIKVLRGNDAAMIAHSWGDNIGSYDNPSTIDIVLSNAKKSESYDIYMTECVLGDFPSLLQNGYELVKMFTDKQYAPGQGRFKLFSKPYISFEANDNLIYKYATKTRKYHDLKDIS